MNDTDIVKKRVKKKMDKIKGGLKQSRGEDVEGSLDKVKGKTEEKETDIQQKWDEFSNKPEDT